ncbi:RES family NAD+ phosphorylase [Acidovorax sp. D4N7]|nr:RES family NAD+ phosphorylase [Acidovorax sp. D4N7]
MATRGRTWEPTDLSGGGGAATGGRWNEKGVPAVYAATSVALACLETLVHMNQGGLPIARYLVELEVPRDVAEKAGRMELPQDWNALPTSFAAAQAGTEWLKSRAGLLLLVPSVIVPMENNVLLNPAHPDLAKVRAVNHGPFRYDGRLVQMLAKPGRR